MTYQVLYEYMSQREGSVLGWRSYETASSLEDAYFMFLKEIKIDEYLSKETVIVTNVMKLSEEIVDQLKRKLR